MGNSYGRKNFDQFGIKAISEYSLDRIEIFRLPGEHKTCASKFLSMTYVRILSILTFQLTMIKNRFRDN